MGVLESISVGFDYGVGVGGGDSGEEVSFRNVGNLDLILRVLEIYWLFEIGDWDM